MSYDADKMAGRREELLVVDLLLDQNDITIDFSSDAASYNTPKTTTNPAAFNPANPLKTYRFSRNWLDPSAGPHFPQLVSVGFTPPKLDPGKSIGARAGIQVTFDDFISNDTFELPAPYDDRRVSGSFWGKLIARNYLHNRTIKVHRGYAPFNSGSVQTETYIVDSITGPDSQGRVTIKALDPLIFTEETKAKAPRKSAGTLTAQLGIGDATFAIANAVTGDYGAIGETIHVSITDEIIKCEPLNTTTFTILDRGQGGTTNVDHAPTDLVQLCYVAENKNVVDIITDMITDYTNIDPAFIPTAEWAAEKAGALSQYNLTTYISSPQTVKTLLDDLILHCGATFYFDVVKQLLILEANPEFDVAVIALNEQQHIEQDSLKVTYLDKDQTTRRAISWDKRDFTQSNDARYYAKGYEFIAGTAEEAAAYGEIHEGKEIFSNWLIDSAEDTQIATAIVQRDVLRTADIPTQCQLDIDSRYVRGNATDGVWLGAVIDVYSSSILAADATINPLRYQVTQIKYKGADKWTVTGISYQAVASTVDYIIDSDKEDFTLTDEAPPIAGRATVVAIQAGVTIGATSTGNPALTTGSYPDGLTLINRGQILGTGGAGGDGGDKDFDACLPGSNGAPGGPALSLTADTVIDNGNGGLIYGGGGGGAGESAFGCVPDNPGPGTPGGGGSGGQGYAQSAGGIGGSGSGDDGTPGDINGPGTANVDGGTWGEPGNDSEQGIDTFGGAPGSAIIQNGFALSITAGNNDLQIKGGLS